MRYFLSANPMILLLSLVLAVLPLLGVVGIALFGTITTVDGLFTSLILLAISGAFGVNVLLELRKPPAGSAKTQPGPFKPGLTGTSGEVMQRGRVEKVEFYEANVGQPNKSIVTLSTPSARGQTLVFEGDLRNALPAGHTVQITFRKNSGYNILTSVASA